MNAGVIFDLDGVLIDSEGLQYKSYLEVLARYGVSVSLEEYCEFWIAAGCGPEHAVEKYRLPLTPDELRALKHPVYHRILRAEVTLMPGAVAALRRMSDRYAVALATNSNRLDVGYVMEHFGLARYFNAIVTRDDYARPKPAADAFVAAAAQLGVPSRHCVVVEDAHKGIVAAKSAGMKIAAVPNRYTHTSDFSAADAILGSLEELTPDLVEGLVVAAGEPHKRVC